MTQPPYEPTPTSGSSVHNPSDAAPKKGGASPGVIALIVGLLAIILAFVIFIIVNSGGDDSAGNASGEPTSASTATSAAEPTGEAPGEASGATSAEEGDLDPRVKEAIEGQWRLEEGDPMALGDIDAKLVFQIYSDYQCGYCHTFHTETFPQLQPLIEDGTIRVEYHELPVLGPASQLAAQASHAAAAQGKFWQFHDAIYADWGQQAPQITEDYLVQKAEEVGVADIEKFTEDMKSGQISTKVQQDLDYATQVLGITGTPSFIIGYSYIPGNIPFEQMETVIEHELERDVEAAEVK